MHPACYVIAFMVFDLWFLLKFKRTESLKLTEGHHFLAAKSDAHSDIVFLLTSFSFWRQ